MEILVLVAWVFLSSLTSVIAERKGRSGWGFGLVSLFVTPVVAFIISGMSGLTFFLSLPMMLLVVLIGACVAHPNAAKLEKVQIRSGRGKKCPFCAEVIRQEASVCRYCGRDLNPPKDAGGSSGGPDGLAQQIQNRFQERYGGA